MDESHRPDDMVRCQYRSYQSSRGQMNELLAFFRGISLTLRWADSGDQEQQLYNLRLLMNNLDEPIAKVMAEAEIQRSTENLDMELKDLLNKNENEA